MCVMCIYTIMLFSILKTNISGCKVNSELTLFSFIIADVTCNWKCCVIHLCNLLFLCNKKRPTFLWDLCVMLCVMCRHIHFVHTPVSQSNRLSEINIYPRRACSEREVMNEVNASSSWNLRMCHFPFTLLY